MKTPAERSREYRARRRAPSESESESVLREVVASQQATIERLVFLLETVTSRPSQSDAETVTGSVTIPITALSRASESETLSLCNSNTLERESVSDLTRDNRDVTDRHAVTSRTVTEAPSTVRVRAASAPSGGERYVAPEDAITPELQATADMCSVQDTRAAWLKFCGYYAGKWLNVPGAWQTWCVKEAKWERTQRDKAAQKPAGYRPPETQEDPWAVKKRLAERERAFDELCLSRRSSSNGPQKVGAK